VDNTGAMDVVSNLRPRGEGEAMSGCENPKPVWNADEAKYYCANCGAHLEAEGFAIKWVHDEPKICPKCGGKMRNIGRYLPEWQCIKCATEHNRTRRLKP